MGLYLHFFALYINCVLVLASTSTLNKEACDQTPLSLNLTTFQFPMLDCYYIEMCIASGSSVLRFILSFLH